MRQILKTYLEAALVATCLIACSAQAITLEADTESVGGGNFVFHIRAVPDAFDILSIEMKIADSPGSGLTFVSWAAGADIPSPPDWLAPSTGSSGGFQNIVLIGGVALESTDHFLADLTLHVDAGPGVSSFFDVFAELFFDSTGELLPIQLTLNTPSVQAAPEPGTLLLLSIGLIGLGRRARARR